MRKPRIFIASSAESLNIAEAVNVNLDHAFEVTLWTNGTFRLSSSTIDDLVGKSSTVDFALFIFTPNDITTIRNRQEHVVRDNVVFEMGLFVGAIGKNRSFILKPRDEEMHLPTDLLGVTPADYDPRRSDGDLVSATNRACSLVKAEADRLGLIDHVRLSENKKIIANPVVYELKYSDYRILSFCLQSQTTDPTGISVSGIVHLNRRLEQTQIQLSLIKLERMGLLSKEVETNHHDGYDYYAFKITELGIDTLLKNETELEPEPNFSAPPPDNFTDDIPF